MIRLNSEVFSCTVEGLVPIIGLLQHYDLMSQLQRHGDNLMGTCPLHKGGPDKITFHVILSKNCWNCLRPCMCGGDVIDFVAKKENVTRFRAALLLMERFRLSINTGLDSCRSVNFTSIVGRANLANCSTGLLEDDARGENKPRRTYIGVRNSQQTSVTVNGLPLNPRFDLWNFHPLGGFEWGYRGEGPSQLALALLADCMGDDHEAGLLSADFRRTVIEKLDDDDEWVLDDHQIKSSVTSLRQINNE